MKMNVTKIMAYILSLALTISLIGTDISVNAAKKPKLNRKTVTLVKGKKTTLKVSGKKIKKTTWKVSRKSILSLSKKKKTSVVIKGKKKGKATITAKIKAGKKTYKLTCKVTVKDAKKKPAKKPSAKPTVAPVPTNVPVIPVPTNTPDVPVPTEDPNTAPAGYEEIDLSTYTTEDGSTDAYDAVTKTLHIVDKVNFQFPLARDLRKGEVLNVIVKGNYAGELGFRSWLVDGNQGTNSDLFNTNNEADFEGGEITLRYALTANAAAKFLFFKGPSYGVNIDDLTITKIFVKYADESEITEAKDPYAPETEQDVNTGNLTLTTSFSEQKGKIGNNPLMTQSFMADPTAVEYDGRLYIFGTADNFETDSKGNAVSNGYNTCELKCISSADLVNWTDHGTIKVNKAATWAGKSWAPTICKREEGGATKFYLYFANGGDGIGVLTADSPLGPWKDPIGTRLISRNTPNCSTSEVPWLFDPAVLVDDDGTGYLYFGGGVGDDKAHPKSARVVKLGADMCSLDGEPQELDPYYLFEDSEINKINGKYVYSYCTNWNVPGTEETTGSACIAYMVSDKPMSDFAYQKKLFANPGSVFGNYYNNHHKLIQFKGEWYIIYHTTLLEETAYGSKQGYRTVHMDKLNVSEENGALDINATATYQGLSAVSTLNPYNETDATTMAWNGGLRTTDSASEKQMVIDSIHTGDWLGLSDVDFGDKGANSIQMKLASDTAEGKVEVWIDGPETAKAGEKVAEIALENTGGKDTYKKVSAALTKTVTGKHNVYFVFRGVGYHISDWQFSESDSAPIEPEEPAEPVSGSALDLSNYNTGWGGSYDEATQTFVAEDVESAGIFVPETLKAGDSIKFTIKGSYMGTQGFRVWLSNKEQTTLSEIETATDNGSFEKVYTLTAAEDIEEVYLLFKRGGAYGTTLEKLTIQSVIYEKIEA